MPRDQEDPDDEPVDADAPTVVDAHAHSAPSATFERFEVEKELGKGGMAVVFRARDAETGEKVALKLLTGNLDAAGRARFAREVRAASKLSHDNICKVVAVGENDGRPFLAMELVKGANLADIAKRGPPVMPAAVAAAVMVQLFDALAHAHAAGVLHRDLKPANVMLKPDGTLKLLDFGIAKSIDDETVTKTGALVGTPAFMAPEQVRLETVDQRADLFSAGMLLTAFLRQNRHRFAGKPLDPSQMLIRVALEPTAPLLEAAPHAPTALDNLVAGLTTLSPEVRFVDALAARSALVESGVVPAEPRALLARFMKEPLVVAAELNQEDARNEAARAHALMKVEGGAAAAALALRRASLLDPSGPYAAELTSFASAHGYAFDDARDEKTEQLFLELQANPQSAALLKRISDVTKAKGALGMHAAYLWRYVRARPDDALALTQLRTLLDGPAHADNAAQSSARLSTRSIVAGIKTGGLKAPSQRPVTQQGSASDKLYAQLLAPAPAPAPAPVVRGPATVVLAGGRSDDAEGGRGRTIGAALVIALVVLGLVAMAAALWPKGGDELERGADPTALLADAERALAIDHARAVTLASQVLASSPTAKDGREALWIRARAQRALGHIDEARADCDLYLLRATDFHDPHLAAVKVLLAELGAARTSP